MPGKLEVGETLGEVFSLYREHAGVLLPIAFWLFLAVAVLEGIAGDGAAVSMVLFGVSIAVNTLFQGVVVGLVRDVRSGAEPSMGDLIGAAAPFMVPLAAAGLLAALGAGIGLLLLVVPGLYLLTIWSVIAPAIVIEGRGAIESFGRSRELVRGYGWAVFGVIVVAILLTLVAALMLTAIAVELAGGPFLEIVFLALAATVTAPIAALAAAVLYYRLLALQPPPAADAFAGGAGGEPPAPTA